MEDQLSIFDILYPKYKITKPIRLIEFFAGYGSQALALKYLGVKFEHWKTCEWAVKSIQAYKDIHFTNNNEDYSKGISKEQIIERLHYFGISSNYNEPMTLDQIKRIKEEQLRIIFNNIVATNNLVNIQRVTGKDLEIVDTDKCDYILTYSFPCQDLSLAGKGKGMSDTSTRSGMLWEVERILKECDKLGSLPQILLMENVPQVHGTDNVEDFNKWQLELEKLGYKNYFQDLIATDYGIPQTRNRCFMISILGDYSYTFPKPIPLKLKLKDMLEDNVDEKYYLSDKMLNCFLSESKDSKFPRKERFLQTFNATNEKGIAATITTAAGTRATDNFICSNKSLQKTLEKNNIDDTCYIDTYNKRVDKDKSGTITTGVSFRNNTFLAVKDDTLQKELCNKLIQDGLVQEGDVIKHSFSNQILSGKKKCVEKSDGTMITLPTRADRISVAVKTIGNYSPSGHNASRIVDEEHCAPTVMENHGTITAIVDKANKIGSVYQDDRAKSQGGSIYSKENSAPTLSTGHSYAVPFINNELRIRKLTPKECFRLMGVKDEDFEKCSKNQSDSSLYHLAGDSIVVNVLMAIFKELL